ncbi:hypothetical protein [Citrobacter enshiensis]|uniref:hypothetical protein n=1 Tax=Citrobacter enshiensis TaxID=2971264 RepID=UPI0023E8C489|nr:hypothetical protein [Citrobacter enshiensis]WET42420.1 hypothetical protein P2W74_10445 [Citrobacter enshiensis]
MKKYGIETKEQDSTPGFRSTDYTKKWFDTEAERDDYYNHLTRPRKPSLDDLMCDDDYISYSYTKIEEISEN